MMIQPLVLFLLQLAIPEPPPELQAALHARDFINAQITWEIVPARGRPEPRVRGVSTYTRREVAFDLQFDEQRIRGVHTADGLYEQRGDDGPVEFYEKPSIGTHPGWLDFRVVGMHALTHTPLRFDPSVPPSATTATYAVEHADGGVDVRCLWQDGATPMEWHWQISPRGAWNAIRFNERRNGQYAARAITDLANRSGVWFPGQTREYDSNGVLVRTVLIRDIKVDMPEIPAVLTPAQLGIAAGTKITAHHVDGSVTPGVFDGQRVVSELPTSAPGPSPAAVPPFRTGLALLHEMGPEQAAETRHTPERWEAFGQRFSQHFGLDETQSQQVQVVVRDALAAAEQYRTAHRAAYEDLKERRARLAEAADPLAAQALAAAEIAWRAPLERIFEEQLLPRLERHAPSRPQP